MMSSLPKSVPSKRVSERDRHSKSGVGGSPKKGGAGGKYTWGAPGTELELPSDASSDPNYDSEDDEDLVMESMTLEAPWSKESINAVLDEYFNSEDFGEVARSLQELGNPEWLYSFVKQAVTFALGKRDRERELTSSLLSYLYAAVIPPNHILTGFRLLVSRVDDLILDTPNAAELLGMFIARAIVDEIIPPSFLKRVELKGGNDEDCISKAKGLLDGKHVGAHVSAVWGPGSERFPQDVKRNMKLLLEEFVEDGGDFQEADISLREINTPFFHFGFIKLAIATALEKNCQQAICSLLNHFFKSDMITSKQITSGFQAAVDSVNDFVKDITPNSPGLLKEFIGLSIAAGFLESSFSEKSSALIDAKLAQEQDRQKELTLEKKR